MLENKYVKIRQEGNKTILRKKLSIGHYVLYIAILFAHIAVVIFFPQVIHEPMIIGFLIVCFILNFVTFISELLGKIILNMETKEICVYNPFPHNRKFDEVDKITTFYDNSDPEGSDICKLLIKFKDGKEISWRTTADEQSKQLEEKLKMLIYPEDHVFR